MAELNLIESVLENIDELKRSSAKTALLYQVLQEHSSAIPLSAMVIFVYTILESGNKLEEQEVIDFLENLIRICYTYDLSQDIKYKVFDINARVMNKRPLPLSTTNFSDDFFEERRRYRNGFVMLYHYLVEDNLNTTEIDSFLKVERIVRQNDFSASNNCPPFMMGHLG